MMHLYFYYYFFERNYMREKIMKAEKSKINELVKHINLS